MYLKVVHFFIRLVNTYKINKILPDVNRYINKKMVD